MQTYNFIAIMLLLTSNLAMSMDLDLQVQDSKKQNRIKSFDAALVVATLQTEEDWKKHSFSSPVVVEIFKKKKLDCSDAPSEQEIALVKLMKQNEPEEYDALVAELFRVLHGEKSNLQSYRNMKLVMDKNELKDATDRLDEMQKTLPYYDDYNVRHNTFWHGNQNVIRSFAQGFLLVEYIAVVLLAVGIGTCTK